MISVVLFAMWFFRQTWCLVLLVWSSEMKDMLDFATPNKSYWTPCLSIESHGKQYYTKDIGGDAIVFSTLRLECSELSDTWLKLRFVDHCICWFRPSSLASTFSLTSLLTLLFHYCRGREKDGNSLNRNIFHSKLPSHTTQWKIQYQHPATECSYQNFIY